MKRSLAFAFLALLLPLSARSTAAATAKVQYIIPQGGDPKVMTFGAVNAPLFADSADLACGSGVELHGRIPGPKSGQIADITQVQMQFVFDGDVQVDSESGSASFPAWNAAVSRSGNFWTLTFTVAPPNPATHMTGSVPINDALSGLAFAFVDVCIDGDPTDSTLSNATFTATRTGAGRAPRFPVIAVGVTPQTLTADQGNAVVTVFGTVVDSSTPLNFASGMFAVADEYGALNSSGPVTLTPIQGSAFKASFSFQIPLDTFVSQGDPDGRHYTVTISAADTQGRSSAVSTAVVVTPFNGGGFE